ncbi:MAG TPA: adenylate/guanylate cyclase domain-containing protein [Actinomycetota bacterium]|nr:adenylate/guanylate cyclase domain-containing protein [Actinomycetota bacterium]
MEIDVRFVEHDGINLAYATLGEGENDIVLLTPWFSNIDVLTEYPAIAESIQEVAAMGRIIFFDRRGTGLSDRLTGPATLDEGMDDLLAVIDAVGADKVHLIAMHEAGTLAMLFAATHPDRVATLVLYATFAATLWHEDYPWGQKPEEREEQIEWIMASWGVPSEFQALINPSTASDEGFTKWVARWQRNAVSRDALPRFFEILAETDVRSILDTIRVPTLIMHRPDSLAVPVENAYYLRDHIKDSRVVELPGQDLLPFFGDTGAFVEEIEEFITGTRRQRDADRILATILFCDVVDSSGVVARLGDSEWKRLLDRLDHIVQRHTRSCGGRVVKDLGDGYLATFDRPGRAIQSAAAIKNEMKPLGIVMRFGLHTGEAEVRGDDLGGIALHVAARVMAAADPDEILVSGSVPPLVVGSGIEFTDRGTHELRGIDGNWQLYAVSA